MNQDRRLYLRKHLEKIQSEVLLLCDQIIQDQVEISYDSVFFLQVKGKKLQNWEIKQAINKNNPNQLLKPEGKNIINRRSNKFITQYRSQKNQDFHLYYDKTEYVRQICYQHQSNYDSISEMKDFQSVLNLIEYLLRY